MSVVLSMLALPILPSGGSVSAMMVPLVLLARIGGAGEAAAAGFLTGCLKLLLNARVFDPLQMVLDYPLAYAVTGLAAIGGIYVGVTLACLARLAVHTLTGYISLHVALPASLLYNSGHMVPEWLLTLVIIVVLQQRGIVDRFQRNLRRTE